jgi:hypothetical protein
VRYLAAGLRASGVAVLRNKPANPCAVHLDCAQSDRQLLTPDFFRSSLSRTSIRGLEPWRIIA